MSEFSTESQCSTCGIFFVRREKKGGGKLLAKELHFFFFFFSFSLPLPPSLWTHWCLEGKKKRKRKRKKKPPSLILTPCGMFNCVHTGKVLKPPLVISTKQVTSIAIQWGVGSRVGQQRADGLAH
eukprot:TRINITY_DN2760_c2_g1_i2.p2 TRINITY_DN2760_c2_g1~~TRINITY_DN2760_c2_g1_i2.p2  ORF type:complete len:139 (-),score=27.13 TRINITY_DN2760_c2_g1_i2:380-754(-)